MFDCTPIQFVHTAKIIVIMVVKEIIYCDLPMTIATIITHKTEKILFVPITGEGSISGKLWVWVGKVILGQFLKSAAL